MEKANKDINNIVTGKIYIRSISGLLFSLLFSLVCTFLNIGCSGDYQLSDSTTTSGHLINITNPVSTLNYNSGTYTVSMKYVIGNNNSGYINCTIYDENSKILDTIPYRNLYGSGTKYWSIATDRIGHFDFNAYLVVDADKEISHDFMSYVVTGDTTPAQQRFLYVWSGDSSKGCVGDTLSWPIAHRLIVQATGMSIGEYVYFKIDTASGSFNLGTDSSDGFNYKKAIVASQTLPNLGTVYLAEAEFIIKKPPAIGFGYSPIVVTCEAPNSSSAYFTLFSLDDYEHSHIKAPYDTCTHQKRNAGGEVLGDNYIIKPNGSRDSGNVTNNKNVYIEMDWTDVNGVLGDSLIEIAYYIDSLLSTAGLEAETRIDDYIETVPDTIDLKQRQGIYAGYRSYKDPKNSFIHIVLGTLPGETNSSGWLGITDNYFQGSTTNIYEDVYFGSGPGSQAYKDSVGCFIFAKRLIDKPADSLKMGWARAIALAAAHEIGHMLGLNHYSYGGTLNIMYSNYYGALLDSYGWEKYGHFEPTSLDGKNDIDNAIWDAMNTRHILGIDCTNIKENNY